MDPTGEGRRVTAAGVIAAVAFAIAGITGVALIEKSVDDTLSNPTAVGQPWDLELQEAPADPAAVIAATAEEPIDTLAFDLRIGGTDFEITGEGGTWLVQPMTFDNVVGTIDPYVADGDGAITTATSCSARPWLAGSVPTSAARSRSHRARPRSP